MKPSQVAGGLLGAVTAGALLFGLHRRAPPPAPVAEAEEVARAEEPPSPAQLKLRLAEASQACEAYADPARVAEWDQAILQCQQALLLLPYNPRATTAQTRFIKERDRKVLYDAGLAHARVGSRAEALDAFAAIPQDSIYFKPAQVEFMRLAKDVQQTGRLRCVDQSTDPKLAMDPAVRWVQCELYARVACHLGWDVDAQAAFERLRATHPSWRCPAGYANLLGAAAVPEKDAALRYAIAARYPDPWLAAQVLGFALSERDDAKPSARPPPAMESAERAALAKRLTEAMDAFEQAHARFGRAQLGNALPEAKLAWQDAAQLDAQIMPEGLQSKAMHAMTYTLADRYTASAQRAFNAERFSESLMDCVQAEAVMPTHPTIAECKEALTYERVQYTLCGQLRHERVLAKKSPAHLAEVQGWMKDHRCAL